MNRRGHQPGFARLCWRSQASWLGHLSIRGPPARAVTLHHLHAAPPPKVHSWVGISARPSGRPPIACSRCPVAPASSGACSAAERGPRATPPATTMGPPFVAAQWPHRVPAGPEASRQLGDIACMLGEPLVSRRRQRRQPPQGGGGAADAPPLSQPHHSGARAPSLSPASAPPAPHLTPPPQARRRPPTAAERGAEAAALADRCRALLRRLRLGGGAGGGAAPPFIRGDAPPAPGAWRGSARVAPAGRRVRRRARVWWCTARARQPLPDRGCSRGGRQRQARACSSGAQPACQGAGRR